ncbi:MAG: hypothetical protein GY866_21230, partial [Proteobacteria bacterium]|nr:hypothetical protein [Pseudomonadota bacterium]
RMIDKIRPGGLACLVAPTGIVVNKGKAVEFRMAISKKAEFLGAHKLPSKTFQNQGTDVVTDILVFRKHPQSLLEKIDDLAEETLRETNIYFDEFIKGKYWQGEGRKFIHGKYTPRVAGERFSREIVDGDIDSESLKRKLAVKFQTRIDWEALEVAEEVVKNYVDGDRKYINGKEYEMIGGSWVPVEQRPEEEIDLEEKKYGAVSLAEL